MAEFDPLRPDITGMQAYRLEVPGTQSALDLSVVSFTATEAMGEPTEVIIEATHPSHLPRADYVNLDAVFSIVNDDGAVRRFSGYLERVSVIQKTNDFTMHQFVLKSHFGRLAAVTTTEVYQHKATPEIIMAVLRRHGIKDHQVSFRLRRQYPVH
ncbi:contractile injection system protein, VgrG/Pvc8 family, partial [Paraburkholderia hiiakae]|uniref:contractile injection system protein, VgrG/Pvc8 family n=1 Tax=Paraburkholderia hiiakae TaxID=1081782 RepID=UPI001F1FD802